MCQYLSDKIQSEKNVQKCLSILYTQLTPQSWHFGHRRINIANIVNIAASLIIEDVLLVHLTHDALIEEELRMK